ncbi:hypothetical protein BH23THE1_BH23THE1_34950 [soil metagenome]
MSSIALCELEQGLVWPELTPINAEGKGKKITGLTVGASLEPLGTTVIFNGKMMRVGPALLITPNNGLVGKRGSPATSVEITLLDTNTVVFRTGILRNIKGTTFVRVLIGENEYDLEFETSSNFFSLCHIDNSISLITSIFINDKVLPFTLQGFENLSPDVVNNANYLVPMRFETSSPDINKVSVRITAVAESGEALNPLFAIAKRGQSYALTAEKCKKHNNDLALIPTDSCCEKLENRNRNF